MIDLVTVGWLTIDDIVLLDHTCKPNVLGGGALYSAVGALIWSDRVGVHSVTGRKHIDDVLGRIAAQGLDVTGINAIEGNGLELWLLHETASDKQQIPRLSSSTAAEMDAGQGPLPAAYRSARGFHIAPQSPDGSFENLRELRALVPEASITLDVLADGYVDAKRYQDLAFLDDLDAFLPSEAEVLRIFGASDPAAWIAEKTERHGCHIAVKLGEAGSLVCDRESGRLYRIPAYPADVLDTTGAGDAFCGGFLAGMIEGRAVEECAAMGTVSASYVVEARGALDTRKPSSAERDSRLADVLARTVPHAA